MKQAYFPSSRHWILLQKIGVFSLRLRVCDLRNHFYIAVVKTCSTFKKTCQKPHWFISLLILSRYSNTYHGEYNYNRPVLPVISLSARQSARQTCSFDLHSTFGWPDKIFVLGWEKTVFVKWCILCSIENTSFTTIDSPDFKDLEDQRHIVNFTLGFWARNNSYLPPRGAKRWH